MLNTSKVDYYPESRFACLECEINCCSLYEVAITKKEREALKRLKKLNTDDFEGCFTPDSKGAGDFVFAKDKNNNCFFASENRCKIHEIYGYDAKPLSCRVFPLLINFWVDGRVSLEFRFLCPAIGLDQGKTISEDKENINQLIKDMTNRRGLVDVNYSSAIPVGLIKVRYVHDAFKKILHDETLKWRDRLYSAARILDFHSDKKAYEDIESADSDFGINGHEFVYKALPIMEAELSSYKMDSQIRTTFRNIVSGYLRKDIKGRRKNIFSRIKTAWDQVIIMSGFGMLRELNSNAPNIVGSFLPLELEQLDMTVEAEKVFKKFFFGKLDSMHFCGGIAHNYTYEEGMRHLLVVVPVIWGIALGYAHEENRTVIEEEDMQRSARFLDFIFSQSPFFRLRTAKKWIKFLSQPKKYGPLVNYEINII